MGLRAKEMLQLLSGKTHEVYTGVAIIAKDKTVTFYERTEVTFLGINRRGN